MDKIRKSYLQHLQQTGYHLAPFTRKLPSLLPVQSIGYFPRKTSPVRHTFDSMNFSLILSGHGTYSWGGMHHPVQSPCVITQFPGAAMAYGPESSWEELFFIFDGQTQRLFEQAGLFSLHRPFWSFVRSRRFEELLAQLRGFLDLFPQPYAVDRIDRATELLLLLETLSGSGTEEWTREQQVIHAVEKQIRNNVTQPVDFDQTARDHGMHPATFRRHWAREHEVPPGQYVYRLRIAEACRLLAETSLGVAEIANRAGFEDPLYFSRRFSQQVGCSATVYRNRHRLNRTES